MLKQLYMEVEDQKINIIPQNNLYKWLCTCLSKFNLTILYVHNLPTKRQKAILLVQVRVLCKDRK